MDSPSSRKSTKRESNRVKGISAEPDEPKTPKRGKKDVQFAEETVPEVPETLPDDQKSTGGDRDPVPPSANQNQEKAPESQKPHCSAAMQKIDAELQALDEMQKLEEEFFQKKRELMRKLKDRQAAIDQKAAPCDPKVQPEAACPPATVPAAEARESEPAKGVQEWLKKVPTAPVEHPYKTATEIEDMQDTMQKMLARQSVPLDLPYFSGEEDEWATFFIQYEESTKMCGLTNQENRARLTKFLRGRALDAVRPLLTVPDNVPRVMETLKMLFGRPQQIIRCMITKMKSLPQPKESKPDTIITFANGVSNLVSTMKNLKYTGHLENPTLLEDLVARLSPALQLQWCMFSRTADKNLEDFSTWLMDIATAACLMPANYAPRDDQKTSNEKQNKKPVLTTSKAKEKKSQVCPKCSSADHRLDKCSAFAADSVDDRWKLVSANKLCFICLIGGHQSAQCRKKKECGESECKKLHHPLLHKEANFVGTTKLSSFMKEVYLKILPVVLSGPNGDLHTYALLDEGSTVTMIEKKTAAKMGLQGEKEPLCIQWTGGVVKTEEDSELVTLTISGAAMGSKKFELENARTVSNLDLPTQTIDMAKLKKQWPYLKNVPFYSLHNVQPTIVIGLDNNLLMLSRKKKHGEKDEPIATKTWLGWVVHGSTKLPSQMNYALMHHVCNDTQVQHDNKLYDLVKYHYSVESFGVRVPEVRVKSKEEERADAILEATTVRRGQRWETGLLWRTDDLVLPDSYPAAFRRLQCMERKMAKDPDFCMLYKAKIEEYLDKGYAIKLSPEEAAIVTPKTWYIPHFAVVNPHKPGKIRMVFDCAAKTDGVSLNSCLLKGPDLLNELPAVLWRFRSGRIGVTADVQEFFHRVLISHDDLQSQRFLWRGGRGTEPEVYAMRVMMFGTTCSPAAAIYTMRRNSQEFSDDYPHVAAAVTHSYYMDDFAYSTDDETAAKTMINDMIYVQQQGGFNLCNWTCSSKAVLAEIPIDLRAKDWKLLTEADQLPTERVLGLYWDPERDAFTFKLNLHKIAAGIAEGSVIPTMRQMLALISSIFDPLGFVPNMLIKGRILFQQVCRSKIQWDDQIPAEIHEDWREWCRSLTMLTTVSVPRCYWLPLPRFSPPELHVLCDSSSQAYAAVAYFRWETREGIHVAYVSGKARVAPLKTVTIPRLELLAALMASRLADSIRREHHFELSNAFFWSDSRTVLCWIRSDPARYKQFVANRVLEIQELTRPIDWRWVPTELNVADDATRLSTEADLRPEGRWFAGPEFLRQPSSSWPIEKPVPVRQDTLETKAAFVGVIMKSPPPPLPDVARFSSFTKLIRATAWVLRFIYNMTAKTKLTGELTVDELKHAEKMWYRKVQDDSFAEEKSLLMSRTPVGKNSRLYALIPYLDENNILRVHSRLEYSEMMPYDTMFPIILDHHHPFTKLLIRHHHEKSFHQGTQTVMNNIRQRFWITSLGTAVKSCANNCNICKIRKASPKPPQMAPLAPCRVNNSFQVFEHTGMDYFGPILVTNNRKEEKRYGVIFTCLATRGIHIEVAHSLTTESCLMAIHRFVSLRSRPKELLSDNGKNMVGAAAEIKKLLSKIDTNTMNRQLSAFNITWRFIPPGAPHMGGAWERLIRSVKTALGVALKGRRLNDEVLLTFMAEVADIVNSRPLTDVSVDPNDPKPITPNDFLRFTSPAAVSWKSGRLNLKKLWWRAHEMADYFWGRWVKEYLPTLTNRNKWRDATKPVAVGDVVLVADSTGPRNTWPVGRVVRLYPGRDGHVRVVDVQTADGVYRRPVIKLAVLDLTDDEEK